VFASLQEQGMVKSHYNPSARSPGIALAEDIIDRIEELLLGAQRAGQVLEVDPYRARLFELFVMADATGFLEEGAEGDLSCDGIGRELSARWDLANSVGQGMAQPASLPTAQLAKLRLLWSFMRMWMEWSYAWRRWAEFHESGANRPSPVG
jgi:hypothetical protein